MSGWSFDIASAPRGKYTLRAAVKGRGHIKTFEPARVFLATKCGQVTIGSYLPDSKRWEMLATNEQPVAWMPWAGQKKASEFPAYPERAAA